MLKRWMCALGVVFMAGCGSSEAEVICEKLEECNFIQAGYSVDECVNDIEEGIENGQATDADAQRCATCMDSHSCQEIAAGECAAEC